MVRQAIVALLAARSLQVLRDMGSIQRWVQKRHDFKLLFISQQLVISDHGTHLIGPCKLGYKLVHEYYLNAFSI